MKKENEWKENNNRRKDTSEKCLHLIWSESLLFLLHFIFFFSKCLMWIKESDKIFFFFFSLQMINRHWTDYLLWYLIIFLWIVMIVLPRWKAIRLTDNVRKKKDQKEKTKMRRTHYQRKLTWLAYWKEYAVIFPFSCWPRHTH